MDRERRLQVTMAVGAALLLLLGVAVGFAVGRATAPEGNVAAEPPTTPVASETTLPAGVVEEVPTETLDAAMPDEDLASEEATADTKKPPTPKQLAPANGAVINASRVNLRWTSVKDAGGKVTYSFEIQDRRPNGTYGNTQVIKGLSDTSYSARVLAVRRRWRVWAVDDANNASSKSPWKTYIHKYVAPKKAVTPNKTVTPKKTVTPAPSDETT